MAQGLGSQQCPGSENSLMPFTCLKITFCMRCLGLLFPLPTTSGCDRRAPLGIKGDNQDTIVRRCLHQI